MSRLQLKVDDYNDRNCGDGRSFSLPTPVILVLMFAFDCGFCLVMWTAIVNGTLSENGLVRW